MPIETFVGQIRTDLQKTRYMAHMETFPLSELRPGQSAAVVKIAGNGPVRRRYLEMGFVKGEIVRVERVAPLGDPVEYQLKGYRLSLRRADASQILVQPID